MKSFEITFAMKTPAEAPSDRITYIGGLRSDGTRWLIEPQIAIRAIESNTWRFFVMSDSKAVNVRVAQDQHGEKFLLASFEAENLLLLLPQNPISTGDNNLCERKKQSDTAI